MPYESNVELPKSVRDSLPDSAQTIYRKAYNSAHEQHPDYDEERLAKISWGAVKIVYKKDDDDAWVRAEVFGAEVPAENYDSKTHTVRAIKVGTVAHTNSNEPFECTAEWLQSHADDWSGGNVIANHYGMGSEVFGDIVRSWWEDPFVMMQLTHMNPETERRMEANEHTGFSFDAIGVPTDPVNVIGTDLSILFYPHYPACPADEGCGIAAKTTESKSSVDKNNIQNTAGSEAMVENTYTTAEIESIKAESAKVASTLATLEAEAKTHDSDVTAYKAEISERGDMISELKETADTLFTAEAVEAKVTEAKATMFSAEDVEAANKEAVETAIAAEKEKIDKIAAELAAITNMFPEGLAEDFRTEIVAMVKEGKSHEAILKLGEIEYTSFRANVPTGTGDQVKTEEIVAEGGAGIYDPATGSFKKVGE